MRESPGLLISVRGLLTACLKLNVSAPFSFSSAGMAVKLKSPSQKIISSPTKAAFSSSERINVGTSQPTSGFSMFQSPLCTSRY